jgi:hypothetical protein
MTMDTHHTLTRVAEVVKKNTYGSVNGKILDPSGPTEVGIEV